MKQRISQNTESDNKHNIQQPEHTQTGMPSADRQARAGVHEHDCLSAEVIPRLVIRGERYVLNDPNSSESIEIQSTGNNGECRLISKPLPKEDAEPQAALTDYLNTTLPFKPTPENIIQLVDYFKVFIGEKFGSLYERGHGLHGYHNSFFVGETKALFAYRRFSR